MKKRLFLAVDLPDPVRQLISEWAGSLHGLVRGAGLRARWTRAEQYHLTLKFLGATDADRIPEIDAVMRSVVAAWSGFELRLSGAGAFPSERKPRVLWVGVQEAQGTNDGATNPLTKLAQETEAALEPLGFQREERRFHPHVTVARLDIPTRRTAHTLLALEEGWIARSWTAEQNASLEAIRVHEVVLYESTTVPSGSVYQPISRYSLASS